MKIEWTDRDFDQMSWHDNAVHAIRIVEGEHGAGEFILDLDYILEWIPGKDEEPIQFRVAPAELRFHEATQLKVALDYVSVTASMTPFSIARIHCERFLYENGTESNRWRIEVNWPAGEITFESPRFTQVLTGGGIVSGRQSLSGSQREQLRNAVTAHDIGGRK
ncbi:MAG: hypothetical protein ABW034_03755 [Steroidobacteraceae bacterium]